LEDFKALMASAKDVIAPPNDLPSPKTVLPVATLPPRERFAESATQLGSGVTTTLV